MSYRALAWAAEQRTGSSSASLVLMALASYADDHGRCWPAQTTIADRTYLTRETVNRTMKLLEKSGFIKKEGKAYILNLEGVIIDHSARENDVILDHSSVTLDHTGDNSGCDLKSQECDPRSQGCDLKSQPSEPVNKPVNEPIRKSEAKKPVKVSRETRQPIAKPDEVCVEVWDDFIRLRNSKRAPLTQTALDGICREAEKAGWPLEYALRECCTRGWQGFKAEWVNRTTGGNHATNHRQPNQHERIEAAGDAALNEIFADIDRRYGEAEGGTAQRPDQAELRGVPRLWTPARSDPEHGQGVPDGSGYSHDSGRREVLPDLDANEIGFADAG